MQEQAELTPKTPTELGFDPGEVEEASEILHPFEKLLPVKVLGQLLWLPENNSLWRGLQFWGLIKREVRIDFGNFCISGTCKKCKAFVKLPDAADREPMLLCQTKAQAGTEVVKLPQGFALKRTW